MSTIASRKNKGRRLQQTVVTQLREIFRGILFDNDIKSTPMGVNGSDIFLSETSKNLIYYEIECKNQESLVGAQMESAIEQAETNTPKGRIPLLVFKRNNQPERVILTLEHFFQLIYPKGDVTINATSTQKLLIQIEQLKQSIIALSKETT